MDANITEDVIEILDSEEWSSSDIATLNDNISIALYASAGGFIADVEFYDASDSEYGIPLQLVFSDGSTEPVDEYLMSIYTALAAYLEEMGYVIDEGY